MSYIAGFIDDMKRAFTVQGQYREIREVVMTAKHNAETYGNPGGGFNAMQFFGRSYLLENYKRVYDKFLNKRLAKLSKEQYQHVTYWAWYYGLEPEEQLAEQVKHMRKELDEVKQQVNAH